MSYSKGDLANFALEELGISGREFDVSPEDRQSVIRRMDMMMAEWAGRNLLVSYPLSTSETPDPDQDSNIPDWAGEAVITNLAIRMAPSYGKEVAVETKVAAKKGYTTVCSRFAQPPTMQMPSMPKGAGYKSIDNPYSSEPVDPYLTPIDNEVDLTGGPV